MTALVKANPNLPAAIAKLMAQAGPEAFKELSGGVTSGFPIISYKGKVWRIRKGGEETMNLDENGDAKPTIEVVLVQSSPVLSKIYYEKQFEEGTTDAPRCFSNDGVKPDAAVQDPISRICANCPKNVWGSKITPNGKKTRACGDARRMAVVFAHDLYEKGVDADKYLLRVPPASLSPLKDYAEKILAPKGLPFFGMVTRIGFDPAVAHPQFVFKPARFINDDEAEAIAALRDSEDIRRILAEAHEFPGGTAAEGSEDDAGQEPVTPTPVQSAPAARAQAPAQATTAPAGKPAKMRPATEEEAGLDALLGTSAAAKPVEQAKPKPAPVVDAEIVQEAPPPRRKKPAAAQQTPPAVVAATVTEEEEEAPPAAPPTRAGATQPPDFDSMLDRILNG